MPYTFEQIANVAQTTIVGAIDGVTNPVTFQVNGAGAFPTSGNFRLIIDSEIFLVTGISGGVNFTANRAQEGTAIASHSSSATATLFWTKGSFFQLLAEQNFGGQTGANRPAPGQVGRLFFPSDGGGLVWRDNGTAWEGWSNGTGPFFPPVGVYTNWLNQGLRGVYDESTGIPYLSDSGPSTSANFVIGRFTTAPAAPWTFTTAFKRSDSGQCNANCGIFLRDATTGHLTTYGWNSAGTEYEMGWLLGTFTSVTTFNTSLDGLEKIYGNADLIMLRLVNNGTTVTYQYSHDWHNWKTHATFNVSGHYTASFDQAGFYVNTFAGPASGDNESMSVLHATIG